MERIIIFGAGNTGMSAYRMLEAGYKVVAFCDNNAALWGDNRFGIPVIAPEQIAGLQVNLIIIASVYHVEIVKQLYAGKIKNIKLFRQVGEKYVLLEVHGENPFKKCVYRKLSMEGEQGSTDLQNCDSKGKKKVLVIAYYFPPAGGGPIQRTLKFVKYLRDYGYEPVVLTADMTQSVNVNGTDESLLAEVPEGIKVIRVKDGFPWLDTISAIEAQEITEFLYTVSDSAGWMDRACKVQEALPFYLFPDRLVLWANECVRHIEEYVDMRDIDLLYSTVPEWSPHLIAYLLKQKYGIKWVADYRDPWVSNEDYIKLYYSHMTEEEIALDRILEKKLVREMDAVIVAGGKWAVDFIQGYGVDTKKIREITNGYDEADFKDIHIKTIKNEKFTLCYNGYVGYHRNPISVIKAINNLIERKVIGYNEVQWIFNGLISDVYLEKMKEEDIYQIIVYNGVLPHKKSIQVGMQSDILVMYGESGEKGYLNYPGKFYEYLRIGRPILCFCSDISMQAEVLREMGAGVSMDINDLAGIESFLMGQIAAWREGKNRGNCNPQIIRYERKNLTCMLAEEFDCLLERQGKAQMVSYHG